MKKKLLTVSMALAMGIPAASYASLTFDANGQDGDQQVEVGQFDWDPASVLIKDGNQAVANWIINEQNNSGHYGDANFNGLSEVFTVYANARLTGTETDSNVVNTPSGLNSDYEITSVIGFTEYVSGVGPIPGGTQNTAAFEFDPTGSTNFYEVFYDTNTNSDYLTGLGFNDGQSILSSVVADQGQNGTYNTDVDPEVGLLDQSPDGDDWGGQLTVTGNGSQDPVPISLLMGDIVFDADFFEEDFITNWLLSNVSLQNPFDSVNPSKCYTLAGGLGDLDCADATDYVPSIGAINGALPIGDGSTEGGPDFLAQTDFNNPVAGFSVPEPASLSLLGLGLLGMGVGAGRRKRQLS